MKIHVTVKPNAKEDRVERIDGNHFKVRVKAAPTEGKANKAVIKVIANYLGISKSKVTLKQGQKSKIKIVVVEDE